MERTPYPSDLTHEQWTLIEPHIPPEKPGGRHRDTDMREVVNGIPYLNRTGCQWRAIPHDLPPWGTVAYYFYQFRKGGTWQRLHDTLRERVRVAAGREPEPRKAAIDTRTVKGSEAGGPRGYDGGKKVGGRKRHLIVGSLGLLLAVLVTAANLDDGTTAPNVLERLTPAHRSRLDEVRGNGKYNNRTPDRYLATSGVAYTVAVVERPAGVTGLVRLPYRWVIERTHAWTGKYRRNSKDYERTAASAEAMIKVTHIHLMLQRLKPDAATVRPEFRYPRNPLPKAA